MKWWVQPRDELAGYCETWWYGDAPPGTLGGDDWSGPAVYCRDKIWHAQTLMDGTWGHEDNTHTTREAAQDQAIILWTQRALGVRG